jgi:hypothetical protein
MHNDYSQCRSHCGMFLCFTNRIAWALALLPAAFYSTAFKTSVTEPGHPLSRLIFSRTTVHTGAIDDTYARQLLSIDVPSSDVTGRSREPLRLGFVIVVDGLEM